MLLWSKFAIGALDRTEAVRGDCLTSRPHLAPKRPFHLQAPAVNHQTVDVSSWTCARRGAWVVIRCAAPEMKLCGSFVQPLLEVRTPSLRRLCFFLPVESSAVILLIRPVFGTGIPAPLVYVHALPVADWRQRFRAPRE